MTFLRGGWWRDHYVLEGGVVPGAKWESICQTYAWDDSLADPVFTDLPKGDPCPSCLRGVVVATDRPVPAARAIRLRAPHDSTAVWIERNDGRQLSPCHRAPKHVTFGRLEGVGTDNWKQHLDHLCSVCGRCFDPVTEGIDPDATTRPEGTES